MNEHLYQCYKERLVWPGQFEHEQTAVMFCEAKQKGAEDKTTQSYSC